MQLSRRPVLAGAFATGSALLGGCLDGVLSRGTSGGDPETDLLVLAGGVTDGGNLHAATELVQLTTGGSGLAFERGFDYAPDDGRITDAVPFEDGAVVVTADQHSYRPTADRAHVRRLDESGSVQATATVDGVPAIARNGDQVVAMSAAGAWVLDADLEKLGSTDVAGGLYRKHMEDVRMHDDVAYVVDDVAAPRYLFRLDVSDPEQPAVIEAVSIVGINHTLGQQWLDPGANRWGVLQFSGTRDGIRHRVLTTPMWGEPTDDGNGSLSSADLSVPMRDSNAGFGETVYYDERHTSHTEGTPIHDVTAGPPLWASLTVDGEQVIAPFSIDPDGESLFDVGESVSIGAPARVASTPTHCYALTRGDGPTELVVRDLDAGETVAREELDVDSPAALELDRS